jgi:predicted amidophosphoribosyltransferase
VAKYRPDRGLAVLLARTFASTLAPAMSTYPFTAVVPTPSTQRGRVRRGFSLAALLATGLARELELPVHHALSVHAGPRQAALSIRGRHGNLAGRVRACPIRGQGLLVDDVTTTGATASACARELLGSGAETVWLATLCAARSGRRSPTGVQNL